MPRPSGHWRMVLFVTVAVIVHVPCWVIWMPVPSCEPEFAVPAVPMMLLSMNIFIVPPPAAPETKLTAWLFVPWRLLLTKRTYMLGDPVPPPLPKLGPMPSLFFNPQPVTVNVPVAGAPTPFPATLLSLVTTLIGYDVTLFANVAPLMFAVTTDDEPYNCTRKLGPPAALLYEPPVTLRLVMEAVERTPPQ